jgi:hypothetical protein
MITSDRICHIGIIVDIVTFKRITKDTLQAFMPFALPYIMTLWACNWYLHNNYECDKLLPSQNTFLHEQHIVFEIIKHNYDNYEIVNHKNSFRKIETVTYTNTPQNAWIYILSKLQQDYR